jgi:glutamate--cysteine ligase catalytic subunit
MGKGKGLLTVGTPLKWDDAMKKRVKTGGKETELLKYVREHGIHQFLSIYNNVKDTKNDRLFWGDEVEYIVQKVDPVAKTVKLSLRAEEIRDALNAKEKEFLNAGGKPIDAAIWHPEYGSFMVESTPAVVSPALHLHL